MRTGYARVFEHLPLHQSMAHAIGLPLELHESAVVHDAVDDGRHLVVTEDRPPAGKL